MAGQGLSFGSNGKWSDSTGGCEASDVSDEEGRGITYRAFCYPPDRHTMRAFVRHTTDMDIVTNVSNLATQGATSAWLLVGNFLVLVVLTVIMIGFSYKSGRGGIISLLLSFYAGYAIYLAFPYTKEILGAGSTPMMKAIISVVLFAIASFIPFHFIQRLTSTGFGVLSFVPRFVLSFLSAAFLLALAYHVFNVSNIYTFPEPLNTLFAPDGYFFYWFIAPLVGLFIFVH